MLKENLDLDRPERALLFEVGRVFREREETHLAGLLFGEGVGLPWAKERLSGYFLLKGYPEALFARLGLAFRVEAQAFPFLHPGVSGRVLVEGRRWASSAPSTPRSPRSWSFPRPPL